MVNITLHKYKFSDMPTVLSWVKTHSMDEDLISDLPEIGYIARSGATPIAAAFLRKVEGNFVLFDSLISDPTLPPELRDDALDLLGEQLIRTAKELEFKTIVGITKDKFTYMRALRLGFVHTSHALLVKKVG